MKPDPQNEPEAPRHDEDVNFENKKESAIVPLTESNDKTTASGESVIPAKEDTLGNSDFPPLTEQEKQPKLPDTEEE